MGVFLYTNFYESEEKNMRDIWTFLQMAFAAIGGWLGWFLGGYDGFLYALIAFVVIDYLLGVMCAILEKHLSSDVGARGIFKKVVIFSLVGVAHIIDQNIIGDGSAIRTAVIFFYLSNEGISIIENSTRLGLPIPEKLRDILEQLKDGGDKDGTK
jgi:toxin secretion/phage lysis holin